MFSPLPFRLALALCTLGIACDGGGGGGSGGGEPAAVTTTSVSAPCSGGCPANTPLDLDADGAKDYLLCGDFDGDGRLTMDLGCVNADPGTPCDAPGAKGDLLGCLEALDDADGRTLEILPGRYEVPDQPFTAHHAPPFGSEAGILEIPSNTTLRCRPGAVLTGTDERHGDDADQLSVLYVPASSTGVVVEDCEIDGGWPQDHDCLDANRCTPVARMGIFLKGHGNVARDNFVHHTRHACIYTKDGSFNEISGNTLDWCGGAWSTRTISHFPGIYVFSDDGEAVEGLRLADNRCDHVAFACIATRLQSDSDRNRIRDLVVERTSHVVTGPNADGSISPCMVFRGLEGAEILDNECTGTSGISIVSGPDRYLEDPLCSTAAGRWRECQNSSRDVALRRTVIRDTRSSSPLWIGSYLRNVLVEDLVIEGPNTAPCLRALGPIRGLVMRDLSLEDCPQAGIRLGEAGSPGTWGASDPEETVEFVDVEILDADAALLDGARSHAVHLAQGCVGCRIENLRVTGWTRSGVFVEPGYALRDADFEALTLDQLGSWHAGTVAVSQLPSCTAGRAGVAYTVGGVASTTSCAAGPAGASNLCVCDGAAWRDSDQFGATAATSPGIDLRSASEVSGNLFSDITCTDVRRRGHCIEAPTSALDNVFTGLLGREDRGLAALDPKLEDANDGVLNLRGASGNDVVDARCEGLRSGQSPDAAPCVCLDASCDD